MPGVCLGSAPRAAIPTRWAPPGCAAAGCGPEPVTQQIAPTLQASRGSPRPFHRSFPAPTALLSTPIPHAGALGWPAPHPEMPSAGPRDWTPPTALQGTPLLFLHTPLPRVRSSPQPAGGGEERKTNWAKGNSERHIVKPSSHSQEREGRSLVPPGSSQKPSNTEPVPEGRLAEPRGMSFQAWVEASGW